MRVGIIRLFGNPKPPQTMKTPQDYEREIAELKRLIERLQKQLTLALETLAKKSEHPIIDRIAQ